MWLRTNSGNVAYFFAEVNDGDDLPLSEVSLSVENREIPGQVPHWYELSSIIPMGRPGNLMTMVSEISRATRKTPGATTGCFVV